MSLRFPNEKNGENLIPLTEDCGPNETTGVLKQTGFIQMLTRELRVTVSASLYLEYNILFFLVGCCFVSWLDQDDPGRYQNELSKTILER